MKARDIIKAIIAHTPKASWRKDTHAMRNTLNTLIAGGAKIEREDLDYCEDFEIGKHWEHFYRQAVEQDNLSACKAIEEKLEMKPYLWAEENSKLRRLAVGDRFHWEGEFVTVTSTKPETLIAVVYGQNQARDASVGSYAYVGEGYRKIEARCDHKDKRLTIRYGPLSPNPHYLPSIRRVFRITAEELLAKHNAFKKRLKQILADIAKADLPALDLIIAETQRIGLRHYEVEAAHLAMRNRRDTLLRDMKPKERETYQKGRNDAVVARWRAGETVFVSPDAGNLLRVTGETVEVSNGQSVTLAAAKQWLPKLLRLKGKGHTFTKRPTIDLHEIRHTNKQGVQIGCTFIAWAEVAHLKTLLK